MSNRTWSEEKVLKKIGIPDFRHMSKDKIMAFATALPHMNPEVARKALEQFPTFTELARDLVGAMQVTVAKGFDENNESQREVYEILNRTLTDLEEDLKREDLTPADRAAIEDKLLQVAKMAADKDTENKKMIVQIISCVCGVITTVLLVGAAILGVNAQASRADSDEDEPDVIDTSDDSDEL